MKKLVLFLLLLLLAGLGTADIQEVQYSIEVGEKTSEVNVSIHMSCDSTCIGLKWSKPSDSEVLFVRDSRGAIDYSVDNGKIDIPGSRANGRENETIKIGLRDNENAGEIYEGLYQKRYSIASFEGVETTGFIRHEDLISGKTGFGFDYSFSDGEMKFKGEGPTQVRVKFGEGQETRYFEFFGASPEDTETAYEVPIGVLGFRQKFERFPVAVMTDRDYNLSVNRWSDGEYVSGSIKIREPESIGDSFVPVLAHEVVHGLNDRKLTWDQTRSSYFDEGTAKYVESLVRKKMYAEGKTDRPPRELFGEKVRYDPDPSDRSYYTIPPKGDKEVLWSYYQNDRDFMKKWDAFSAEPDARSFGYAYSELVIANYVSRMNGSIIELYRSLDVNRKVSSDQDKWRIFSEHLDMTPCKYEERERFEACLEAINDYDYPVYSATNPQSQTDQELQIDLLEIPERKQQKKPLLRESLSSGDQNLSSFLSGFLSYLGSVLQDLVASF